MPRGIYPRRQARATARDTSAPRTAPTTPEVPEGSSEAPAALTAKLVRTLDGIRATFLTFVQDFATLTTRREELAPKFMKAFNMYQAETGESFVNFVRALDPSVPADRTGYRGHRAYQAADYLRRLVQQNSRVKESPVERANRIASAPVNTRHGMARVLATFAPLVDEGAMDVLWKALGAHLHWTEGQIDGMKALVEEEPALVKIKAPKGVEITHALKLTAAPVPVAESQSEAA